MKKIQEIIGWILLFGFIGCLVWVSIATEFTANQYIATLCAAVVMGFGGTAMLVASQRKKESNP